MKFRPLHDRVVIKRIEAEEKTSGGIIIPDTAKEKPQEGEVIAVGPGGRDESGKLIPIDVKVGDRVLFGKWSGTEVKLDGRVHDHEGKRLDGGAGGSWRFEKGRLMLQSRSVSSSR
jgi:chaperonin GroES